MMDFKDITKDLEAFLDMDDAVIDFCQKLSGEGFKHREIAFSLITNALTAMMVEGESEEEIKALYAIALREAKERAHDEIFY